MASMRIPDCLKPLTNIHLDELLFSHDCVVEIGESKFEKECLLDSDNQTVVGCLGTKSMGSYSVRIGNVTLFCFYEHLNDPEFRPERDQFVHNRNVTGNGRPVLVELYDVIEYTRDEHKPIYVGRASFDWQDERSDKRYRRGGPSMVDICDLHIERGQIIWSPSNVSFPGLDEDTHKDLYRRLQNRNPFLNPVFDDPQDELEYLVHTK